MFEKLEFLTRAHPGMDIVEHDSPGGMTIRREPHPQSSPSKKQGVASHNGWHLPNDAPKDDYSSAGCTRVLEIATADSSPVSA